MAQITDPTDALVSFQKALLDSELALSSGAIDSALYVFPDMPNGVMRLTYVYLEGKTVTALASFVATDPIDGVPCFQVGVAVPSEFRGKGLAKKIMLTSIAELRHGLGRNKIKTFAIEAVVAVTNEASKRVAEATISKTSVEATDSFSGVPILQYVLKIGP